MTGTDVGLREQKKAETRRALREAAMGLFTAQGYERTTVRDIAAAAGVVERTFFRYFPSKEDLVLSEVVAMVPVVAGEILGRPSQEEPLTAVCRALLAAGRGRRSALEVFVASGAGRLSDGPTRPMRSVLFDFEEAIAEALAQRLGPDSAGGDAAAGFRAEVLARVAVAAARSALIAYSAQSGPRPSRRKLSELTEEAFRAIRSG